MTDVWVGLLVALIWFLRLLNLAILGRVLYSWIDPDPFRMNQAKRILWSITEPILEPLRRVVPPAGMFDLTPLVALLLTEVLARLAQSILIDLRGY